MSTEETAAPDAAARPAPAVVPLRAQIAAVERELAMRRGVYARKVEKETDPAKKERTRAACRAEYDAMAAVLRTLRGVQEAAQAWLAFGDAHGVWDAPAAAEDATAGEDGPGPVDGAPAGP